jgi:hypothetical protein
MKWNSFGVVYVAAARAVEVSTSSASRLSAICRIASTEIENPAESTLHPWNVNGLTVPSVCGTPFCTVSDLPSSAPRVCVCRYAGVAPCCAMVEVPPRMCLNQRPKPLVATSIVMPPDPMRAETIPRRRSERLPARSPFDCNVVWLRSRDSLTISYALSGVTGVP